MKTRRMAVFFAVMILGFAGCALGVRRAQESAGARQAVQAQSTWTLQIDEQRGAIYDRQGRPFTGQEETVVTAVAPGIESGKALAALPDGEKKQAVMELYAKGTPFLFVFDEGARPAETEGIQHFTVQRRYGEDRLASHTIGTLDGSGHGVSGIEKAYDDFLTEQTGELSIAYTVGASGTVLQGVEPVVTDTRQKAQAGIRLTLDQDLQRICETAGASLGSGAVVMLDVQTGEILAMSSCPSLSSSQTAQSPYLNKTIAAYSVGSVFKIVSAASALEQGFDPDTVYDCEGAVEVEGISFHCFNGIAHGQVDMEGAFAVSCNGYFVQAMSSVSARHFMMMAEILGFGQAIELAEGFSSASGSLPQEQELENPAALANFSFGQGTLTATPLQVAAMTAAVASGGQYRTPVLLYGLCDENRDVYQRQSLSSPQNVMKEETASFLASMMETAVQSGTAQSGAPESVTAAAKTGTAQTGVMEDGEEEVICWYTGFFPAQSPRYVVTVMQEGVTENTGDCAAVFAQIADKTMAFLKEQAGN